MTDGRQQRLEQYEAWAAEYEILARTAIDHAMRRQYEHLTAHYRHLAASFRDALTMHSTALAKLTLH